MWLCAWLCCWAVGQRVSMMNCDSSHCDDTGFKPVRAIVTGQRSHFAFELLLCCYNEGIFFSEPNPREVVCVCMWVTHAVAIVFMSCWPITRGFVVFFSLQVTVRNRKCVCVSVCELPLMLNFSHVQSSLTWNDLNFVSLCLQDWVACQEIVFVNTCMSVRVCMCAWGQQRQVASLLSSILSPGLTLLRCNKPYSSQLM